MKKVRRVRRGGKRRNNERQGSREKRLRRWRKAAEKLKRLVGEKRKKCWRTFVKNMDARTHGRSSARPRIRGG